MSSFLPDTWKPDNQRSAESSTAETKTAPPITDADRELAKRILRPELFNEALMSYIVDYAAVNTLPIPVSMIEGYGLQAPYYNVVNTSETTTSTTYADLATSGPTLTKGFSAASTSDTQALSDGVYLIIYGFTGYCNNANNQAYMSLSLNSAAASDADAVYMTGTGANIPSSYCRATVQTLRNGNQNTGQAKYRVTAGTGTYVSRFVIAFRITTA